MSELTTPWATLSARERTRLMIGLVSGQLERAEVAARCGLTEASVEAMEHAFARNLAGGLPEPEAVRPAPRRISRRWLAAASVGVIGGTSLVAYALDPNCASGLTCFVAGEPAAAEDVNLNFKQLKDWIVAKVGAVDDPKVSVGSASGWNATIGGATTRPLGIMGLLLQPEGAAVSGDSAWVHYQDIGSDNRVLEIGVGNDAADAIALKQGGQAQLVVDESGVNVNTVVRTAMGVAVAGDLNVTGPSNFVGETVMSNVRVGGSLKLGSQVPIIMRTFNMGQNMDTDTGYSVADWSCFLAGFAFRDGDINENQAGDIIQAYTYTKGGKWWVRADFRAHNNEEEHEVGIACVSTKMSQVIGWWAL